MNDRQLIISSIKERILKELSRYKEKITVNRHYIGNINVDGILSSLIDDTPWLFFVDEWRWEETGQKNKIFPKYKNTRKHTEELRERCQQKQVNNIKR